MVVDSQAFRMPLIAMALGLGFPIVSHAHDPASHAHVPMLHAQDFVTPYAALAQVAPSRITIGQAILIAEKETGGEAVEAELDEENGRLVYEVDVVKGKEEFEILVNPETGEILSVEKDD